MRNVMKSLFIAQILLWLVAGVANAGDLQKGDVSFLKGKKVAVVSYFPFKKLDYGEVLYKVLFITENSEERSIEGIWNPLPDLNSSVVGGFNSLKADAFALDVQGKPVMDFTSISEKQMEQSLLELSKSKKSKLSRSKPSYYSSEDWAKTAWPSLPKEITDLCDYVFEVNLHSILIKRHAPSLFFGVYAFGRLTAKDGTVLWNDKMWAQETYVVTSFEELEKDNLKLLKQYYSEVLSKLFSTKVLYKSLTGRNLSPYKKL